MCVCMNVRCAKNSFIVIYFRWLISKMKQKWLGVYGVNKNYYAHTTRTTPYRMQITIFSQYS